MMSKALIFALLLAGLPAAAYADESGGAIGAIVRAPGDAAAGIIGGLTGAGAPRFHHYVVEENVPSYTWSEHPRVVVGDVLPAEGVILRPVPPEYGVTRYQYTVVDDTPVLVDPATRRIVEVVP
jgi:Protein of unknown function (DUF1236)